LRVPAVHTQEAAILEFGARKAKFQFTTGKIKASITRLKEYRSALITAAVTGQIDVAIYARSGSSDRRLDTIQEEMGA